MKKIIILLSILSTFMLVNAADIIYICKPMAIKDLSKTSDNVKMFTSKQQNERGLLKLTINKHHRIYDDYGINLKYNKNNFYKDGEVVAEFLQNEDINMFSITSASMYPLTIVYFCYENGKQEK